MPLEFSRYQGIDRDRAVCLFALSNGKDFVQCAASWALMDDLDGGKQIGVETRDKQFARQRLRLAAIAERKFFSYADDERPVEILLRADDSRTFPV
jgi:hypothetical protein